MSYNYLPLDRKWLNFQQVKNLLDFNQQVSITFDAHERILKSREYLDAVSKDNVGLDEQSAPRQNDLLKSHACGVGEEVPVDIVKLMLMLKIKSLSYGHSGVHIETVKRLMEMYNNEVFPVIYTQGSAGESGDSIALSHLALPLIGLSEVYHKGQKMSSSIVLQKLNWQPLSLHAGEALALLSGTHFTSAYAMYALKKAQQLLQFADIIAALSFAAFDCSLEPLHPKLHSIRNHKGHVTTAANLLRYLGTAQAGLQKTGQQAPSSFACIPQVHGGVKDSFDYVLNVFLQEINSVTEKVSIFPDEKLVLTGANFNQQPLSAALDFLAISTRGVGDISAKRTGQLLSGQRGSPLFLADNDKNGGFKMLQYTAASLVHENRLLATPASASCISIDNQSEFISVSGNAAVKTLQLINNVEKVLTIELIAAAKAMQFRKDRPASPFIRQLLEGFNQQVGDVKGNEVLHDKIQQAAIFLQSYKP